MAMSKDRQQPRSARSAVAVEARHLVDRLKPVFAGLDPDVAGATLGELVAIFLASHAPELRDVQRELLLAFIDDMVPFIVAELIDEGRVPETWRGATTQ
jgi:hypothetical protein